jgi:hypothetical protein
MNNLIPAAVESMIESLLDPNKNRFLKESHLEMMKRSISEMQKAIDLYEKNKNYRR